VVEHAVALQLREGWPAVHHSTPDCISARGEIHTLEANATRVGTLESGGYPQKRAATRLAGAENTDDFASLDRQRNIAESNVLTATSPITLTYAEDRKKAHDSLSRAAMARSACNRTVWRA
jgi:hypothetical protein